jgi:hypothetical protein
MKDLKLSDGRYAFIGLEEDMSTGGVVVTSWIRDKTTKKNEKRSEVIFYPDQRKRICEDGAFTERI